jgi:DNA-binding CsgD family transcriptional regulator/tetratricopeptide (TPR) repeat protein
MARLALRSPECRRILRLLAPAGGPLTIGQLTDAATAYEQGMDGLPPRSTTAPRRGVGGRDADLTAGRSVAVEAGIVVLSGSATVADGRIAHDAVVAFRHELLGRAVALDILPTSRRRHRTALATALADHPAAAADHWLAAHENERARQAAIEAAARAESVDASVDALAHLELALELATGDPDVGLQTRAAEAAFGAAHPARASAHAESAIARLDERRDRLAVARLHERLGRYRRAAGDHEGALASIRRALEIVPADPPSLDRARALAALAQMMMLEGTFSEAERQAREAIRVCSLLGPDSLEELHAMTTLGVALGWGNAPDSGIALLRDVCERARRLGDRDGYFRAAANLTTVLDLLGRREDAIEVAYEGIAEARRVGQEAVYGNFLRGNAADSLFLLGRWEESRTLSMDALEWSEGDVSRVVSLVNLATVEIESNAGELAGSLLGQALLDVETVREAQYSVPAYQAAASFALWRGDLPDARRAAERGWGRVRETEDWSLASKMAATVLEVDAASAIDARQRRDLVTIAAARSDAAEVLALAQARVTSAAVPATFGSRREADANLATATAYRARLDGRDVATAWDSVARHWAAVGSRYQVARARWRQAEAILSAGDEARSARAAARGPLLEAAKIASQLGAGPLLRELVELAGRALITLPENLVPSPAWVPVGPGADGAGAPAPVGIPVTAGSRGEDAGAPIDVGAPSELVRGFVGEPSPRRADTFGLSPREKEVLALIAQGRTNREIGERLFISQKTVGVHVGNILAKLGVSGRVEAATVAIRLGLTDRRTR